MEEEDEQMEEAKKGEGEWKRQKVKPKKKLGEDAIKEDGVMGGERTPTHSTSIR